MPSPTLRVALILALTSPAYGFVATWRAYGMDPYTYTWQMPLEPNSTTGLGGGIVYAINPTFCERILPRFQEQNQVFAYFEFVSCRYLRAALSRAFTAWSANHPYIKFIDKSAECDAANSTWDELSTSCPGVELLIDTTTEDAKQNRTNEAVAHIEYTSARGVPRSPNGQEHTSTRTADGQTEITDFARIKFSARPCWYLDTTFCASFHAAEVGGGSETVLTAGKAVVGVLWAIAAIGVLATIANGIRHQVLSAKELNSERLRRREESLLGAEEGGEGDAPTAGEAPAAGEANSGSASSQRLSTGSSKGDVTVKEVWEKQHYALMNFLSHLRISYLTIALIVLITPPAFYFQILQPCWCATPEPHAATTAPPSPHTFLAGTATTSRRPPSTRSVTCSASTTPTGWPTTTRCRRRGWTTLASARTPTTISCTRRRPTTASRTR